MFGIATDKHTKQQRPESKLWALLWSQKAGRMQLQKQLAGDERVVDNVENRVDFATEDCQNGDDNQSDQRDQQTILNQRLSFFFLHKTLDHWNDLHTSYIPQFGWWVNIAHSITAEM